MEEEIIEKVEGGRETGLSGSGRGGGDGNLNWKKEEDERVRVVYRERGSAWSLKLGNQIREREIGERKRERDGWRWDWGANKETVRLPSDPDDEREVRYTCGQDPYIHWRMAARRRPLLSPDGAFLPSQKAVYRYDFLNSGPTAFVLFNFLFIF